MERIKAQIDAFSGNVEIEQPGDQLANRPTHRPRHGWKEQFQAMAAAGHDRLLDVATPTEWESEEWEW